MCLVDIQTEVVAQLLGEGLRDPVELRAAKMFSFLGIVARRIVHPSLYV